MKFLGAWLRWIVLREPTIRIFSEDRSTLTAVHYTASGQPWCWAGSWQESVHSDGRLSYQWSHYSRWEPYVGKVRPFP
jgi:hypothetical protein